MAGTKNHDYHILPPSIWPFAGSMAALVMAVGAILWMHSMDTSGIVFYAGMAGVIHLHYARQAGLAQAAQAPHVQPQRGCVAELDGRVAQVHVTRDRQARAGFSQACRGQAVAFEQGLRVVAQLLQGLGQALHKPYRQVAQAHPWPAHAVTAIG